MDNHPEARHPDTDAASKRPLSAASAGMAHTAARHAAWLPAVVFAIAALCAVLPLVLHGCSCGHDFDFHLLSWMEAASQWQHGILKPVWAFTPAYNAGEPRLLMYPPLSWATGATLGLLLPWPAVPIAFTWLVLFLCGLTMHRLLRRWTSPALAILGGCVYMVNPYMLFVAYERSAYAELMAAAWMPLLLAAMLRTRVTAPRVAVAVALLWLSNAPAAVVGCYSVLLLAMLRLLLMRGSGWMERARVGFTVALGVALGLLLDAFYLLPMGWERRFVQLSLAVVPMARPDHNFLFARDADAFHTHVLLQASWIAVATCITAVLCGAAVLWLRPQGSKPVQPLHSMHARQVRDANSQAQRTSVAALLGFSVAVFFLLSRWSAPVWHVGPQLVFLQFPWRFLSIASAAATALLVLALHTFLPHWRVRTLVPAGVLIALVAGYFAGGRYFREECGDDEAVQAQRERFLHADGVDPTDEYTPAIADNGELPLHLPPAWIGTDAQSDPGTQPARLRIDRSQPDDLHFAVLPAAEPSVLIVRVRQFPGWHTLLDGVAVEPKTRPDGLMVVPLSADKPHRVEVRYRTTTDQWAGIGVTGVVLLLCSGVARRRRSGIMGRPA